jgi:hypothetical protein
MVHDDESGSSEGVSPPQARMSCPSPTPGVSIVRAATPALAVVRASFSAFEARTTFSAIPPHLPLRPPARHFRAASPQPVQTRRTDAPRAHPVIRNVKTRSPHPRDQTPPVVQPLIFIAPTFDAQRIPKRGIRRKLFSVGDGATSCDATSSAKRRRFVDQVTFVVSGDATRTQPAGENRATGSSALRRGGNTLGDGTLHHALHDMLRTARERVDLLQVDEATSTSDTVPTVDRDLLPPSVSDAIEGALIVRVEGRALGTSLIFCTAMMDVALPRSGCQSVTAGDRIAVRAAFEEHLLEDDTVAAVPMPWTPLFAPESVDGDRAKSKEHGLYFLGLLKPVNAIILATTIGPLPRHLSSLISLSPYAPCKEDENCISPTLITPLRSGSNAKRRRLLRKSRERHNALSDYPALVLPDVRDDISRATDCVTNFSLIQPHDAVIYVKATIVVWSGAHKFAIIRDAQGLVAVWRSPVLPSSATDGCNVLQAKCRVAVEGLAVSALRILLVQLCPTASYLAETCCNSGLSVAHVFHAVL